MTSKFPVVGKFFFAIDTSKVRHDLVLFQSLILLQQVEFRFETTQEDVNQRMLLKNLQIRQRILDY